MNRAQRRAASKGGNLTQVAHLTEGQHKELVKKEAIEIATQVIQSERDQVILDTIENSLAAVITVLHEQLGLGKKRIQAFMEAYNAVFDGVLDDSVDLDQLKAKAAELGVNLGGGQPDGEIRE